MEVTENKWKSLIISSAMLLYIELLYIDIQFIVFFANIHIYIHIYEYIRRTPCGSHGCRGALQVQVSSIKCVSTGIKYKYKYQVSGV